jgi:hypothetical protein
MYHHFIMTITIKSGASLRDLRDISEDLQSRIDAMEALLKEEQARFQESQDRALAEHKKKTEAFQKAITGYRNLLSLEQALAEASLIGSDDKVGPMPEQVQVKMPLSVAREPLSDFFIAQLKEKGPQTKEELRLAALFAGYFAEGDGGGRTTHATLANIARSGRVAMTMHGGVIKYKLPSPSKEELPL